MQGIKLHCCGFSFISGSFKGLSDKAVKCSPSPTAISPGEPQAGGGCSEVPVMETTAPTGLSGSQQNPLPSQAGP